MTAHEAAAAMPVVPAKTSRMRLLSQLHEGPLLEGLNDDERVVVEERRHDSNAVIARFLALPMLLFSGLLVWIDLKRSAAGLMDGSALYVGLAVSHALYVLGVLPSLLLWAGERLSRRGQKWALEAHIAVMSSGLLMMAVLGIIERGGLVLLAVAMLVGNLMYQVPLRPRLAFNIVGFSGCGIAIWVTARPEEDITLLVRAAEFVALVITCAILGGLHNRQRLASLLAEHRMTQMAMLDALTGVSSRRHLDSVLLAELAAVGRGKDLAIILTDVDRFKSVNDRFGHDAGDDVLRAVARVLQQGARLSDVIGRWGGEEFMIICPGTKTSNAADLAERLAQSLRATTLPVVGTVTASFGVAQALAGETARQLVERADKALYEAKQQGRDRVIVAP